MKNILNFKTLNDLESFKLNVLANNNYGKYIAVVDKNVTILNITEDKCKDISIILQEDENNENNNDILNSICDNKLLGEDFNYELKIITSNDINKLTDLKDTFSGKIENKKLVTPKIKIEDFSILSNFTGLTDISGYVNKSYKNFFGNIYLKNIALPNSLSEIGNSAFSFCISLKNISIPNSVTSIKTKAFYNCTNLKELILPESIKVIENSVFVNCNNLNKLVIKSNIPPKIYKDTFKGVSDNFKIYVNKKAYNTYIEEWSNVKEYIVSL